MHLGFLTPEYPHPRTTVAAGLGTSIRNLTLALVAKGVKVSVFVYSQKEDAVFTEDGIKLHLIKHRRYKYLGWYLHRKTIQNYLNKFIAVEKIDAIEAPDWTGITAFMKLRCPLVIRMNGTDAYFCKLENRPQKKKNFYFESKALKSADHLLSVSQFTAEETRKLFGLKKKITVIPNSVDVETFTPLSELEPKACSILYFGTIIRKKGVLELPSIFNKVVKSIPEAVLYLAGNDVVDTQSFLSTRAVVMEEFSPTASRRVKWLGPLPYSRIKDRIARSQVVVLPSFAEALPMAWLEAMAMEKALVTSDIGWAGEVMIDGETGYKVDPRDHSLFAERVLHLLENPATADKMGKAARQRVIENFSSEVVSGRNLEFYKELVKG